MANPWPTQSSASPLPTHPHLTLTGGGAEAGAEGEAAAGEAHLWNNEPHNEGHPHCKKLIVDNEPIWAHYQNNEPCSLCQKYNEGNNEGNNDAHCWAHCWRNTMRATMRLIVGERAPF